ncbi:MAG: hypothetical protein M3680_35925 [Myxococcota bacterium]|nr:hypothetical protein [Myxococcota bacterium]
MRGVIIIAVLSACGFSTAIETTATKDAQVTIDAPPDAPPVWTVVEGFAVDTASPTGRQSTMALAAGVTYRLRVSGVAVVIDGLSGDGEYYDFASPKDLACCEDVGIGIDDPTVDTNTLPNWGPYNPQHVYEIDFIGNGARIKAVYQDTVYGNNTGSLMLEILELR